MNKQTSECQMLGIMKMENRQALAQSCLISRGWEPCKKEVSAVSERGED